MSEQPLGKTGSWLIGEVVGVTSLTWATTLLLLRFGNASPLLQPYVHLLAMAPLIYLPLPPLLYHQLPLARYGLTLSHAGRALALTILTMAIVFPPFALASHLVRLWFLPGGFARTDAAPFDWFSWLLHMPQAWPWLLRSFAWEALFVALPEEFFYRGYLQGQLNVLFAARCRSLGTAVGLALPIGAALFALHHVIISPIPPVLLVFFPALLFGWLRETSGSLLAPILFHAACNVFAQGGL